METRELKTKEDFDRDGYVLIRGFLDEADREEVFSALDRYIAETIPTVPREHKFYEDVDRAETLKQMCHIKAHDPYFTDLMGREKFRGLAELLLNDDVVCHECEWFDKPPEKNGPTPSHQDGYYFPIEPNEALTMWLAIDPVDQTNGCLRYVPGSHRKGLRAHNRTDTLGFSQGIADYGQEDRELERCIEMQPGDLAVHHSVTIHRAEANPSNHHRRALGLIYFAGRARFDKTAQKAYYDQLFSDLGDRGKI